MLLACFAQLDWATRFQVVPLVCRSWAELASSAAPELWGSVTVDFTSHMWLRAGRLAAWLRRRGSAICSLALLNSDSSLTPWVRGWVPGSRMRHSMHDFYPLSEEGLARVLAPLHALRELRIARCDDLLQRGALACALRALPLLERLELTTTDPAAWRGVEWRSLRRLRSLALRHGPLNIGAWPPNPLALGAEEADPETGFPLPLADLRGLTSLLVHHQEMRALPDEIALLTELRSLTLCGRSLRELPAAVGSLPALEELSLRSCPLGERGMPGQRGAWALPPELARCPLRRLDLMNCQLEALPVAVGSLAALEELSLGYNRLTWLPDNLAGLAGLRSLSLFGNDFDRVPAGLQALTRLEELFMDENPRLQFGQGAAVLLRLPRLRCLSVMQDSSPDEGVRLRCIVFGRGGLVGCRNRLRVCNSV